ncbi:MAG: hypothetical protein ACUVX8_04180 [Candidatus Zipacnadales bacterium]
MSMAVFLALCSISQAAYLYDMGTAESAVRPGFLRVLADSKYTAETGFGWMAAEEIESQVRVYKEPVENVSRGTTEPPPIYTNELTEDALHSSRPARFAAKVAPGTYDVHVLCGVSAGNASQYWDFTVSVGNHSHRVQIEGPQRFVWIKLDTTVTEATLTIEFLPASRWCVNAILIVGEGERAAIEGNVIMPLKQEIFVLPPEEWAKWQEDPHVDGRPWFEIGDSDKKRGYLLHHRHYLEPVFPNTVPLEHTLNPELRAFASLGEYEPLTFTVWPLRELRGVMVKVSDLRNGTATIPASQIDVRHVPYVLCRPNYTTLYIYRRNPDYLLRVTEPLDLPASENHRFWLTVHVPENATPGLYRGEITFSAEDVPSSKIPIRFRVLPIRLQDDPTKIYGIYYHHPLDRAASAPDEVSRTYWQRKAELEHRDMVEHGTRNITLSIWSPAADEEGKFNFNFDLLAEKLTLWEKYGFKPPIVMSFNVGAIYRKYMKESYGNHLRTVKEPPPEFAAEVTAAVAEIERERKSRGWPEFLYYPIDEPSTSAQAVSFMVTVLKAVKAVQGVRTYVTAAPTYEAFNPMRPLVDVWCTKPFEPDRETVLADMAARGVEYWCYPNHINSENDHTPVAGARMTYGFGFWRSGFRTLIPWIYQSNTGNPWNYLDGPSMDFFNRSEPDGTPIPVAMWEAYREGWDDYRYIYTLTQLIEEAHKAGHTKAANEAQAELDYVWKAIRVQPKYKYDDLWGYEEFDAYRWLIARKVMELTEKKQ